MGNFISRVCKGTLVKCVSLVRKMDIQYVITSLHVGIIPFLKYSYPCVPVATRSLKLLAIVADDHFSTFPAESDSDLVLWEL